MPPRRRDGRFGSTGMSVNELRRMLSTTYDLVCSVGSDCGCAGHLIRNRLRRASYPLDWVGTWYNGIVGVARLVESNFSGFLQLENLRREPNPPRAAQDDHDHDYYHDVGLRIDSAHDFPVGVPLETAYPAVRTKYDRRIRRFYESLGSAACTLLVYWTWRDCPSSDDVCLAAEIFRAKFPGRRIDLLVMRNADRSEIAAQTVGDGIFLVDGPFHPSGGHPAFGDKAVNDAVFSLIRLKGKRREDLLRRLNLLYVRFLSAFIFDRGRRHAFRERRTRTDFSL